jgi:hypothetical protein
VASRETLRILKKDGVKTTHAGKGRPAFGYECQGDLDEWLERRSAKNILWAVVDRRTPLKAESGVSAYKVSSALARKVRKLTRKGGFLRSSAPIGRLVRKHRAYSIWFKKAPEEAVAEVTHTPRTTFEGGLAGLNLAFQLRMRQPGGIIPPG